MLKARTANTTDLGFINGCILYGARKGHYAFSVDKPEMVSAMKRETQSIISGGLLTDRRQAAASVFTQAGDRVGILIMCEAQHGSLAYEIYALSVTKKHQHKGYGRQMLDHVLEHYLYHDIYARCLPASATMKILLTGQGFVFHQRDGDFETYVKDGFDRGDALQALALRY